MAGRALDDELLLGEARGLRIVRHGIVFGVDRDNRMTGAVGGAEAGRKARDAALDLEVALLQEVRHQLRRFELLHAELTEIEDVVAEQGDGAGIAIDIIEQESLLLGEIAVAHCLLRSPFPVYPNSRG